jgi:hypothetical protein
MKKEINLLSSNSMFSIQKKGLDKKSFICFSIIIIEVVLVSIGILYLYTEIKKTNTVALLEKGAVQETEVIDDLTAPKKAEPVPEEVMNDLTVPKEKLGQEEELVPDEVIDGLTAPEH